MSTKTNLISEVKKLAQSFNESKEKTKEVEKIEEIDTKLADSRKKGCDELYEHIKGVLVEKVKTYASFGRNEARVYEFKFGDCVKFGDCYAKDLLTKGDVIQRIQEFLDKEHSDADGPSFFVYFTHIGRYQNDHAENKYGVFVNWDKTQWDLLKERLSKKTSENKPQMNFVPRGRGGHEARGGSRGRGYSRDNREQRPFPRASPRKYPQNDKPFVNHKITIQKKDKPAEDNLPEKHE